MKKWMIAAFAVYLVLLVNLVLFKGPLFFKVVTPSKEYKAKTQNASYKRYNLVPFRTIKKFLNPHPSTSPTARFFNLVGNILLFLPFGCLLPVTIKKANSFGAVVLAAFTLSLFFELFQLFTHTGECDIDDLILNTLGAIIGFGLYVLFRKKDTETAGIES